MKKFGHTIVLSACLLAAGSAHAQLGSLTGMLGAATSMLSGGATPAYDVNGFLQRSMDLSDLTSRSLLAVNAAFAADSELQSKRAALAAISQIADPKEKRARVAELYKAESAETQRLLDSGEFEKRVGTLSSEKKKMIGVALANFAIGSLQAVDLAKNGQAIVRNAGMNPIELVNVLPVKDALPVLGRVGVDASSLVAGLVKLAKGANIDVPSVGLNSKPLDIAI